MNRVLVRSQPTPSESGSEPARRALPYGLHLIEEDDIAAVVAALRSDLLAQGPRVAAFEAAFAARVGAAHAVAVSSGTAALHMALAGLNVGAGDVCVAPASPSCPPPRRPCTAAPRSFSPMSIPKPASPPPKR